MTTKQIKISQIIFSEVALRSHSKEDDHIIELKNDIVARGLLNLPTVVDNGDGTFTVTDGARRCTALGLALDLGEIKDEVMVQVKPSQSNIETLADQFAGNASIKASTNKEYIASLYTLATEGNYSLEELAKKVGKTVSYINRLFKTLKLGDKVMEEAEKQGVSISNLISLADLVGRITEEELIEWLPEAAKQNASDFSVTIQDEKDSILQAAREARKGKTLEFEPKEKFIGKESLRLLWAKKESEYADDATPENEAVVNVLRSIFSMDENSIAEQKATWDAKQKEREDKKAERKAKREAEKAAEAEAEIEKATK